MKFYAVSDIGKTRTINQDNCKILEDKDFILMILADGMGGHNAGEVASEVCVNSFLEFYCKNKSKLSPLELIDRGVSYSNESIYKMSKENPKYNNMGTTVVVSLIYDNVCYIGHVGDSRAYVKNEYGFRQITKDHSLLNDLVKDFDFNEEEIKAHINKNIITRAVGTSPNVKVDSVVLELEKGSYILLCSDGLTNELSDEIIAHNIKDELPLKEIGDNLINSANQNGGRDNISLCIFKLR